MKTLVFVADGTEEIEAITLIDVLRRAGLETLGVSIKDLKRFHGAHKIWSSADMLIDDITDLDDVSSIIIPGGMEGVENLAADKRLIDLLKKAASEDKLIGAICAGPLVLEEAGLLEDRDFTCYPGLEEKISGNFKEENVVFDGKLVTSRGPATAMEFALSLVEVLKDKETRQDLEKDLLVKNL